MAKVLNLFQFDLNLTKVSCSTKELLLFKEWATEGLLYATTGADKFI